MSTGTRLISGSLLVGLIAFATATAGHPSTRVADFEPEPVKCKLRGAHFLGTTRQSQKVCLTISTKGRRLVEYVFQARWKCSDGTRPLGSVAVRPPPLYEIIVGIVGGGSLVEPRPSVRSNGSFVSTSAPPSRFSGQIRRSTANGILRWHVEPPPGTRELTCDTGSVRWTARRAAH
jgi:hypothetical protein